MVAIFLQTLPFFLIIALGFAAAYRGFFPPAATGYLTKFVFYFALPAMLFRFSANLTPSEIFDPSVAAAYLCGTLAIYLVATVVAIIRKIGIEQGAFEAQCAVIGNVGFLGIPMLAVLMGQDAVKTVMLVLAIDLIVFGSLIVILITGSRDGRMSLGVLTTVGRGLMANPMIMAMAAGLLWSVSGITIPAPMNEFLSILGAAATPGALFAIGCSLAGKSAERVTVAGWLSFCKLVLHPAAVALTGLVLIPVDPYAAAVMIAAAALPVAGNVYILAQHYGVAPSRVSASILISTAVSIGTVSVVIAWVQNL
ncbi:MAG: AEC family transporter [Pseudomonadota bacterium]